MMKKFLSALCLVFASAMANAVPALRNPFVVTQSDGTQLTLVLVGDEHLHYYTNVETGEKMMRGEDGDYYVIDDDIFSDLCTYATQRRAAANQRRSARMKSPARVGATGEMTGHKKGIVILVNFSDMAMSDDHTTTKFYDMFNKPGYNVDGHIGSVADYFKDQSYGQFELDFDVLGPVTLSNTMSYYGGNNFYGDDMRPGQMVKEACRLVDDQVNFADYDWDGDGRVEQVFVIYAGYGENFSGVSEDAIWPHEWDLYSATGSNLRLDDTIIGTYACASELYGASGNYLNGIGTAVHEFSHCLGYPDGYDTDYSGGVGMANYDVMCSGSYNGVHGSVPAGFTAYERWMAGWLTPVELSEPTTITSMKDLGSSPTAYVIYNNANRNEFFLIENRQSKGWFSYFDTYTAGHGLFISHIDFDQSIWNNNRPNDDPNHQRMTWVPADKSYGSYLSASRRWSILNYEQGGDFFPGTQSVKEFKPSDWSDVGGKWFTPEDESYFSQHLLTNITENTTVGTVSFKFDGETANARYTVTYNAGTGKCAIPSWTQTTAAQSTLLPTCTINSKEWTFAGWTNSEVAHTSTSPAILLSANSSYTPEANVVLYAVYTRNEANGIGGAYVLDYSAEPALAASSSWGSYGKTFSYTATDGSTWSIKATKNKGIQIEKNRSASIKVPACPAPIVSISITASKSAKFSFSSYDYYGLNLSSVATSGNSANATIDLSGKNLTTGYIYTTSNATVISRIVVNYGAVAKNVYATSPEISTKGNKRNTVVFISGSGKFSSDTVKEDEEGGVVIPDGHCEIEGWDFAGWSQVPVSEPSTDVIGLYTAGLTIFPEHDINLYAVYSQKGEQRTTSMIYCSYPEPPAFNREGLAARSLGTFCIPFAVSAEALSAVATDVAFYEISHKVVEDGVVTQLLLAPVTELEAGIPYIFYAGDNPFTLLCDGANVSDAGSRNGLHGSFGRYLFADDPNYESGNYFIVNSQNQIQAASAKSGVNANRAFIVMSEVPEEPQALGSRMLSLGTDGFEFLEPTLTTIDSVESTTNSLPAFDLQGRQVLFPANGIYIVNGRKVLKR